MAGRGPETTRGVVTIERAEPGRRTRAGDGGDPIVASARCTWRPGAGLAAELPEGFGIAMDCLAGADGLRRFAPAGDTEAFLVAASLGGMVLLARLRELDDRARSGYHAMRLVFQLAPRLREHLGRSFARRSDLAIPGAERAGRDRGDVLPGRVGLDGEGRGDRWTVAELLGRGRAVAGADAGEAGLIAAGLLEGARLDPLDPARLSEAEALGLVRMALFDAGPAGRVGEADGRAVTRRLLEAMRGHLGDDAEAFRRWFFDNLDGLVHSIAKQKKGGGPIPRETVRQALLGLVFDSYTHVGDCVRLQMRAFLRDLPEPLGPAERALFGALYSGQPHLGGLPLILLRDRFPFLRGAILGVLAAPGDPGPVGVLLRLLQYYEEMAAARREVDRGYKRRAHHRDARGRVAVASPLDFEPIAPATEAAEGPFDEVVARLLDLRGIPRPGAAAGAWRARLLGGEAEDDSLDIAIECQGSGLVETIRVGRAEFERAGREILGAGIPSAPRGATPGRPAAAADVGDGAGSERRPRR